MIRMAVAAGNPVNSAVNTSPYADERGSDSRVRLCLAQSPDSQGEFMAKPNYSHQKKLREQAAKKKREEKLQKRQQKKEEAPPQPPSA
jgi:hypothetical protein